MWACTYTCKVDYNAFLPLTVPLVCIIGLYQAPWGSTSDIKCNMTVHGMKHTHKTTGVQERR